ncbi:MAG TPA: class I tRNA ligase family protein [Puia sp.]|nr:class I tRNA ligase family protein [Puia sp.]
MEYNFRRIEEKWQEQWIKDQVYRVNNDSPKPKYYVLDMFPYPSGAGLHVGHPLGYIASDIFARYKRLKGFNVLHPMGYDAFGLPAEQYAIEHGVHPAISTATNIKNFRSQLDRMGFSFDWSREVNTSYPKYYRWTQWIFLQLFNSYYNRSSNRAESIAGLAGIFEKEGNQNHPVPSPPSLRQNPSAALSALADQPFKAADWASFDEKAREDILMEYRLAYCGYGEVNWCEALGTVLANDEVINGVSERGGYPVVKKKLRQWYLRITEYADRLIEGLADVDFSESMKEMQANWIGKSHGAEIDFAVESEKGGTRTMRVYTTRPDTIFGVDFMVVAPETGWLGDIVSMAQEAEVKEYMEYVKNRSDRERQAEKKISGCFTGAYALNPFNGRKIPIWVSEYVLAGYGTGAIMAVPCGDERDFRFASHFNIPITNIIGGEFNGQQANDTRDAKLENSDFLNGVVMSAAIEIVISRLESLGLGKRKKNYKMRDAAFSRQRYWGEPFPIQWKSGIATPLSVEELPLELPHVANYGPGSEGEGPLAVIDEWTKRGLETNTMPGYAGSSWYFLRYMDPDNDRAFCSRKASDYWGQVDLYVGGTEHAVGHLLYSRLWTKVLYDLDLIGYQEPYKKLVNQGMIQGSSRFVYRLDFTGLEYKNNVEIFVSSGIAKRLMPMPAHEIFSWVKKQSPDFGLVAAEGGVAGAQISPIHVDVNIVDGVELDIEAFKTWRSGEFANAVFITEDGRYICGVEVEKMSKRYFNTVNPSDLCDKYGADTYRMYEMFLGPVEQSKPWDTKGIEGVYRFLKKLWRLFYDENKGRVWNETGATEAELRVLHRTIKKIEEDTERFSFNTGVSASMIAVNELGELGCHKREVLEPLIIILSPYIPHVCEELWHHFGNNSSILDAVFPRADNKYLIQSSKNYPVALNGRTRTELNISLDATQDQVESIVLENETVKKWLEGRPPKKIIYVKNKMINVVV